ncbi:MULTISPECIES: hypothetical protein [Spirulina sp. CCY15215]|uniref:hypothetical protein n=1 Tax=Spirulina sp. CCY15215 TaxID=2767591 RepID=UPI00194F4573|nr:hypothetical protein [Spirulina major]
MSRQQLKIATEKLGKPCSYYPKLAKIAGGIAAGILLGYLLEKSESLEWIGINHQDIERDTGLSLEEQRTARKQLKARNLVKERMIDNSLNLSLDIQQFSDKLEIFAKFIFSEPTIATHSRNDESLANPALENKSRDRFFPVNRKILRGPWHSQEQFEDFQKALLEYCKIQGLDNPMAYVFKIVDGMTKGIISPFWDEFIAGKPLGSSQKIQQEWEIKPGVPYPAFIEEIIQYYIHKGEPIDAATARANRELRDIDRAKSWWEGFLRKSDRFADEAIKAQKSGVQTPYLPPSFSVKDGVNKQQVVEKLLSIRDRHTLKASSRETDSLQPTEASKKEPHSPSLPILQKAYNTPIGRTFIGRQIAIHPEWGYKIVDGKIVDVYPF